MTRITSLYLLQSYYSHWKLSRLAVFITEVFAFQFHLFRLHNAGVVFPVLINAGRKISWVRTARHICKGNNTKETFDQIQNSEKIKDINNTITAKLLERSLAENYFLQEYNHTKIWRHESRHRWSLGPGKFVGACSNRSHPDFWRNSTEELHSLPIITQKPDKKLKQSELAEYWQLKGVVCMGRVTVNACTFWPGTSCGRKLLCNLLIWQYFAS